MQLFRIIVLSAIILFTGATSSWAQQIRWAQNVNGALPYAKHYNKFVLVYFFSQKAKPCQDFQSTTLRDPMVIDYLNKNFISVAINVDTNRASATRHGVFRVPTTVILDTEGNQFSKLVTYYAPSEFLTRLREINPEQVRKALSASGDQKYQGALFQESFDSLYGWGNDGSQPDCTMQFSLVPGVLGRAFKINYNLLPEGWSYAQFNREFDPIILPDEFTIVFKIAGKGGDRNHMDLKFIDTDYESWGSILYIPTDYKPHTYVLSNKDFNWLWGDEKGNKKIDPIKIIQIAITPDRDTMDSQGINADGELYLDELIILPGGPDQHPDIKATRLKKEYIVFSD